MINNFKNKSNLLDNNMNKFFQENKPKSNLNDLAFISGILEKPILEEIVEPKEQPKERKEPEVKKKKKILSEGKNDKIELGTVEIKSDVANLYTISIANVPGKGQFQANLYSLILKYIEEKLPQYLETYPDIKDLQNYTKAQLAGKSEEAEGMGETGEEGVELGLAPEGGEVPTGETELTAPAGGDVTAAAGVPSVEGGELPAV